jgi:hypothetical protein
LHGARCALGDVVVEREEDGDEGRRDRHDPVEWIDELYHRDRRDVVDDSGLGNDEHDGGERDHERHHRVVGDHVDARELAALASPHMALLDDYSGEFVPGLRLTDLSRSALARLGREWLMHGHLQDRVGMPLVHATCTREEMEAVAIAEWMAASPVYSRRTQRALRFGPGGGTANGDVATILKNIQLDIGAPHQFLDFRSTVHDAQHGEFFLAHCGALMDVEPMGVEYVQGMCHTIEDPTFDATAVATNPRAQVRPLHRPPRVPADQHPHCHWTVTIDDSADPVQPHPNMARVEAATIATLALDDPGRDAEPGGWADYSGDFDTDFELEDLSHRALVIALQEVAAQSHLLLRGFVYAYGDRSSAAEAEALVPQVLTGLGGLTSQRLCPALGIERDTGDAAAIAKVLQLHPSFHPRAYVGFDVERVDADRVRFAFSPSPIFEELDGATWLNRLGAETDAALDSIVQGVDRRAHCEPAATRGDELFAYEAVVDPMADPAVDAPEVLLAKISTGATFQFTPRRPVRV